jgi:predicted regulator of Ras-like GTPase activity (Roadblock/LC7/MglB family)
MFGKIAKLFKRSAGKQSETAPPFAPTAMPERQPLGRPKYAVPGMDLAVEEAPQAPSPRPVVRAGSSDSIVVPFSSILQLVPKELHGKASAGGGSAAYQLPTSVAMEQLSRGAVKVAFGDLRRAAPAGFFAGGGSQDSRLVDLPLREILNQISPEAFARRPGLAQVRVPDEVNDLFGSKGERLTELRVMDKSELKSSGPTSRQPSVAEPEVPSAPPLRAPEAPAVPIRVAPSLAQQLQASPVKPPSGFQGAPKPPAPPQAPATPKLPTAAPGAPAAAPSMSAVPKVPVAPAVRPVAPLPATTPALPPNTIRFPTVPQATAPAAAPQPAASSQSDAALSVSIGTVSQKWPAQILAVIRQLGVTDLEIPNSLIEAALKSGKIEFPWQEVVSWLRPAPNGDVALDQAGTILELPLSVVAPLYLQQSKYKAKKSSVPGGIPDLFSNKGDKLDQTQFAQEVQAAEAAEEEEEQEEAEAAPVFKAAPRPVAPAVPALAPTPAPAAVPAFIPDPTRAKSLAELFGEPNKKNWTPNEIVQKTITMRGIIGALIALQDGLLVAGSMPQPWKTETIAAFIPQIFGRLTQYTKELQMGEVKTVSFGVDGGTLQIFNAGIIYFGALGKSGSALPVEDLTLIASELSRHTK